MKYVCEGCGKQFDNEQECMECERWHKNTVVRQVSLNLSREKMSVYGFSLGARYTSDVDERSLMVPLVQSRASGAFDKWYVLCRPGDEKAAIELLYQHGRSELSDALEVYKLEYAKAINSLKLSANYWKEHCNEGDAG